MYRCEYFAIHELVPPLVFEDRGEKAWELLDERLLISLDRIRGRYGPVVVNNYVFGGEREWAGLRTPGSPYYRPYSQHTFGRAADLLFRDTSTERVRAEILVNPDDPAFVLITCVELNTVHLHIDVRNTDRIKGVYPNA